MSLMLRGPIVAVLAFLLAGCAHMGDQAPGDGAMPSETGDQALSKGKPADASVPGEGMSSDLVYEILAGEISGQRGDFRAALGHYMKAAEMTGDPGLAERATRIAIYLKDVPAAMKAVELWISAAPQDRAARQTAAVLHISQGDLDEALVNLRPVLEAKRAASPSDAFSRVAGLITKGQDPGRVTEVMKRLADGYPNDADAHYAVAVLALRAEDPAQAESSIRTAIRLKPEAGRYQVLLSRILALKGDKEGARAALAEGVRRQPDSLVLRSAYARLLVEEKDMAGARQQFVELLKTQPDNTEVLYAAGIMSLQLDDKDQAQVYFERLVELDKKVDDAAFYLGQIAESAGRDDEAIAWYERISDSELELDARLRVIRLQGRQGNLTEARTGLQQLRNELPEQAVELYLIEGSILSDAGQLQSAMRLYDEALLEYPDDIDLLYARALQAVDVGRLDILERDLQRVLEIEPEHADALNALGYSLADETDRYREALDYIERALALKPDNAAILDSMGWVQYRLGNYQQAIDYLRKALDMTPDSEIAAHFGEVLWVAGQRGKARKVWDEALTRDPDSEELQDVMRRFQ